MTPICLQTLRTTKPRTSSAVRAANKTLWLEFTASLLGITSRRSLPSRLNTIGRFDRMRRDVWERTRDLEYYAPSSLKATPTQVANTYWWLYLERRGAGEFSGRRNLQLSREFWAFYNDLFVFAPSLPFESDHAFSSADSFFSSSAALVMVCGVKVDIGNDKMYSTILYEPLWMFPLSAAIAEATAAAIA